MNRIFSETLWIVYALSSIIISVMWYIPNYGMDSFYTEYLPFNAMINLIFLLFRK